MSQDISSRGAQQKDTWQGGVGAIQQQLNNAQDQANGQSRFIGVANNSPLPAGATAGSLAQWSDADNYYFSQVGSGGAYTDPLTLPRDISATSDKAKLYITLTTSALPPSTTDLPLDGNYGWHLDTSTSAYYWAYNAAGVIVYPNFLSIAGTITLTQHGNLGSGATKPHDFTQFSGTISNAQHALVTGSGAPFHNFVDIGSTITDAQHGSRAGGTLHSLVTTTVDGFCRATDRVKLNDMTSAISGGTTLLNCTGYFLADAAIIGSVQKITIAAVTGTAGAAYTSVEQDMINDLKALVNQIRNKMLNIGGLFGP